MQYRPLQSTTGLMLAGLCWIAACKGPTTSTPQIVNGADATGEYPEVAQIETHFSRNGQSVAGKCTGTFVSDTTLITAAHCVYENQVGGIFKGEIYLLPNKVRALSGFYNPKGGSGVSGYDLAVVIFPPNTSSAKATVRTGGVNVGDEFTIVGYGCNKFDVGPKGEPINQSGFGTKRKGNNKVAELIDGMIDFKRSDQSQPDQGTGIDAASCSGDSGGPMFIKDTNGLIGVTSGGGVDDQKRKVSLYVDFSTRASVMVLAHAAQNGANIPGILPKDWGDKSENVLTKGGGGGGNNPPSPTPPPDDGGGGNKPNPTPVPTPRPNPPAPPDNGGLSGGCVCGPVGNDCAITKNGEKFASTKILAGDTCNITMCKKYFANTIATFCK